MRLSSISRFEGLVIWAQALLVCGLFLVGVLTVSPFLVVFAPFGALLPFVVQLRPRRALPENDNGVVDAGVSGRHGWIQSTLGTVWLAPDEVEGVVRRVGAAPVDDVVTAAGVRITGVRRRALLDPLAALWRSSTVLFLAGMALAYPFVDPLGQWAAFGVFVGFASVVGALVAVLPYGLFWVWHTAVGTPVHVELRGRVLTIGFADVVLTRPQVEVLFEPDPVLRLIQDGEVMDIEAPYNMLVRLRACIRSLPPLEGSVSDVPIGLQRLAERS